MSSSESKWFCIASGWYLSLVIDSVNNCVESNDAFALVLLYYAFWLVRKSPATFSINQEKKPKTNRDLLARVFLRLTPVTCIFFDFWLVHCVFFASFVIGQWLLWFWCYDTQLETASFYHFKSLCADRVICIDRLQKGTGNIKSRVVSICPCVLAREAHQGWQRFEPPFWFSSPCALPPPPPPRIRPYPAV